MCVCGGGGGGGGERRDSQSLSGDFEYMISYPIH